MTPRGTWRDHVNRQILREHLKWAHSQGGTRLDLQDCNLDGMLARGTQLYTARFQRCTFVQANLSYSELSDMELEDCVLDRACFVSSDMNRSRLYRCRFVEADLRITRLKMTDIVGSDFSGALLDRADFTSAILKETSFRGAFFYDATLDDAYVGYCDWRDADLGFQYMAHLCTAKNTWFFRCDFRGTNLAGRRLQDARFTECRFYGVRGQPVIAGSCTIGRPNLSPLDGGEELGTADQVLQMWTEGAP
jgi:uncharacterized protein YjbI with pentapeptide repeats